MTPREAAFALAAAAQQVQDSDAGNMTLGTALSNFYAAWGAPNAAVRYPKCPHWDGCEKHGCSHCCELLYDAMCVTKSCGDSGQLIRLAHTISWFSNE